MAQGSDSFSLEEFQRGLQPHDEPWRPPAEYADCEIHELIPGPRAVTFMGRVANLSDVPHTAKTARSAKGCVKICVKDDKAAITVRFWYARCLPPFRLGALVSVWTNHVSNGENNTLSSPNAPLFASLFPERDRTCHLMIHGNSDDQTLYTTPLGFCKNRPLAGLVTLQTFIDGGAEKDNAKVLVVVKNVGTTREVQRKDESATRYANIQVQDDTATAMLGLWGISASSPHCESPEVNSDTGPVQPATRFWEIGETVLLFQSPGLRSGRGAYLSLQSQTIVDVNPIIPDTFWLRKWARHQKNRETINPLFTDTVFDVHAIKFGPVRCLFTLAELDDFARVAPSQQFQGYMSLLIAEVNLVECWKKRLLFSGQCCNNGVYANEASAACSVCTKPVSLRLNPRVVGHVVDETGGIASGSLLFSEQAWKGLLGREPQDLLILGAEEMRYLSDRLLFCRITVIFGWTGDEGNAGGRICILGVC